MDYTSLLQETNYIAIKQRFDPNNVTATYQAFIDKPAYKCNTIIEMLYHCKNHPVITIFLPCNTTTRMISEFLGNNVPEYYTQIIAEGVFGRGYESLSFVGIESDNMKAAVVHMFGPNMLVKHVAFYNLSMTDDICFNECDVEMIEVHKCKFLQSSTMTLPLYSNMLVSDTTFVNMDISFDRDFEPIENQDVPPVIAQSLHKYNTMTFERCKFVQENKEQYNKYDSMISTYCGLFNPNCVATLVISNCDVDVTRNFIDDFVLDLIVLQNNHIKASELFHPKTHRAILRDNVFEQLNYYVNFDSPNQLPHDGKVTELIETGTRWTCEIPITIHDNMKHPNIKWLDRVTDVVDRVQ